MTQTPTDPMAWFRDMVTQWETMTNQFGGEMSKSPEFSKAMHGMNTTQLAMRQAMSETMEKALAAANMPSRAEIVEIGERLSRIEDSLRRIEATGLSGGNGGGATPERIKPKRTKKPAGK